MRLHLLDVRACLGTPSVLADANGTAPEKAVQGEAESVFRASLRIGSARKLGGRAGRSRLTGDMAPFIREALQQLQEHPFHRGAGGHAVQAAFIA
jgi:hypothetical protein